MKKKLLAGFLALLMLGATIAADQYDVLFVKCNGTADEFVDSSTAQAAKDITANGNATQLTIPTAFAGKQTAGFFNGTTDYVDTADSANFAFGTGAFEIEFYFCTNIAATAQTLIDNRNATADTDAWLVNIINSTGNKLCFTTATTARITGTTTLAINTWYKAKLVGNGGADGSRTVIMYLATADGDYAQEGSTYTANYNFAKEKLRIGSIKAAAGTYMNGWMKNVKLTKASTTILDMRFDSPATSPLAPAIWYNGTDSYHNIPDHDDLTPASAYTMQLFVNFSSISANSPFLYHITDVNNYWAFLWETSNKIKFLQRTSSTFDIANEWSFTPIVNRWYHIALTKNGNDYIVYVNGVGLGTQTDTTAIINQSFAGRVGSGRDSGGSAIWLSGYVREVMLSKEVLYTGNFTPSQSGYSVNANTAYYFKGNENNGTTGADSILDYSGNSRNSTLYGACTIKYTEDYRSCIFKDETGKFPYPQGSAKVDFFSAFGSGVYWGDASASCMLKIPDSADWDWPAEYTVEFFVRSNNKADASQRYIARTNGADGTAFDIHTDGTNIGLIHNVNTTIATTTLAAINFQNFTWYHIAASRDGSNDVRLFLNGTQIATGNSATDLTFATQLAIAGRAYNASDEGEVNGLMDNIRISKGIARYTTTFNPPEDVPKTGSTCKKASSWWYFF